MKKWILPLLTFLMTATSASAMNEEELLQYFPVPAFEEAEVAPPSIPTNLRLLGKGVQNKTSNESIAIACYSDDCANVRFVYFDGKTAPEWIGDAFKFKVGDSTIERLLVQEYLSSRETVKDSLFESKPIIVLGIVGGSTWAASAAATTLAVGAVYLIGPMLVFGIVDSMLVDVRSHLVSKSMLGTFTLSQGTNGWNWAVDPKRVSGKNFTHLHETILSTQRFYTVGEESVQNFVRKKINKYYDRKARLPFIQRVLNFRI